MTTTVRVNVSVPSNVRQQMLSFGSKINWSKVATDAFRKAMKPEREGRAFGNRIPLT